MLNSKLLEVWNCLSPKQLKKLGDFIASPYFNKNMDLITLYKYLFKYAPDFSKEKALNKETVFKKVFKGEKYDAKKLGYCMSHLVKLTERFLVIHTVENDAIKHNNELLKLYSKWQLEKHYRSTFKENEQLLEKFPYKDSTFFHNQFLLEEANDQLWSQQLKHDFDDSLHKKIDNLDIYYLSAKLRSCCEVINRKTMLAEKYEVKLLDEILAYLEKNPHDDVPCISIYQQILLTLLETEQENHFIKLKNLLSQYSNLFSPFESRNIYTYAVNYTIRKINSGHTHYQKDLFDLYIELLDKEIIFDDGLLSPWTYKNIVSVALRNGDYDWTAQFIDNYKEHVDESFRQNAYAYNLAYLNFHKKNYSEAMQLLMQVEFSDIYYSFDSKTLLMKIYFELDEIDLLHSHIHAFKIYLRRNRLASEHMKAIYRNLAEFTRRLSRFADFEKEKVQQLKEKVLTTKKVADLNWLMQKIDARL